MPDAVQAAVEADEVGEATSLATEAAETPELPAVPEPEEQQAAIAPVTPAPHEPFEAPKPDPAAVSAATQPPKTAKDRLKEFANNSLNALGFLWENKAWVILLLVFGVFVYVNLNRSRPATEDVPALWNASIKKLGVEPIYPPQEGLMVGDVYIMVAPIREEVRGFLPDFFTDTFTGRSIKIGQIDLIQSVINNQTHFNFPESKFSEPGKLQDLQDGSIDDATDATSPAKVRLYEVAFPKVVISRTTDASSAVKWFTAAFNDNQTDSISFNRVQTFAAPSLVSSLQLQEFCAKNKFCENDKAARKLLSYTLGNSINQTYRAKEGDVDRYIFDIEIFADTQVFATRRITVDNNVGWTDDLNTGVTPGTDTAATAETGGADTKRGAAPVDGARTRFGYKRVAGTGLSIDATFQRPVVFAYRKVGILLPRENPLQPAAK